MAETAKTTKKAEETAKSNTAELTDERLSELSLETKVSGKSINRDWLRKSGALVWPVMLDGSFTGIDYLFNFSKVVAFTQQETRKSIKRDDDDNRQYFSYAEVLMSDGQTIPVPINEGLFDKYFSDFVDDENVIDDGHDPSFLSVKFNVKTVKGQNGQPVKEKGKPYDKKIVSQFQFLEAVTEEEVADE